jgi:alpha-amylase
MSAADQTFDKYSKVVQDKGFNFLSYISSHDTKLFFADYEDFDFQKRAANSFLMLPGQIQVYYGDESGRRLMKDGGVLDQSVRSDMNWSDLDKPENKDLIEHWSKLSNFRLNHPAIAAGIHKKISNKPYAFMRTHGKDKVVIVAAGRK